MKQKKSNKISRTIGILILIGLLYTNTFAYDSTIELQSLSIALLVLIVLTIILLDETKYKIREMFVGRLKFTRGLAYCLVSLPILYDIVKKPKPDNYLEQSVMYFFVLLFSIFHFGTSLRSNNDD